MIIISDIHGCYYTLRRLLKQCPDEPLFFLGDLVDRGPHSNLVVDFAMTHKIPTTMGNHEHMMVDNLRRYHNYDPADWFNNGGIIARKSWGFKIPLNVVEWMESLPYYIIEDKLLLSHTGHGMAKSEMDAVWSRGSIFPKDGYFRVFGHTPSKEPIISTANRYARIDTGAAYADRGYGVMTALQWPSLKTFSQPYDETPL